VIVLINPYNGRPLRALGSCLEDDTGAVFHIKDGVVRIAQGENYAQSFGIQWSKFGELQLDRDSDGHTISRKRFFAETHWDDQNLGGMNVLEVGSGAGRFSRVILKHTSANLYTVDYSEAVSVNVNNNYDVSTERFHVFQASVYEMPFLDNSFDKVVCLGVLQHTPDFDASVKALISKAKIGAEIVVDFYPINGWWTKIHAKYLLRPITKRLSHARLMRFVEANIDWLMKVQSALHRLRLGVLTRFLPIVDIQGTFPLYLSSDEKREWAILDTFDMFSPEYDNPQRPGTVAEMFERHGAEVTFAGFEHFEGFSVAVVRGIKRT
jgi:ubiquinone/menaquinone biosynthesis C-methylase UbiE